MFGDWTMYTNVRLEPKGLVEPGNTVSSGYRELVAILCGWEPDSGDSLEAIRGVPPGSFPSGT